MAKYNDPCTIGGSLPEFEKFHVASLVQHKVAQCAVVSTSFLAEVWKSSQ